MKNHKGAAAALLTLGLVVIGALITLGTSLFVNNQRTNLASNSMAYVNCTPIRCPSGSKSYYRRGSGGSIFRNSDCTGELSYSASASNYYITYCTGGSTPSNTPVPGGGSGGDACSSKNGFCEDNCANGNWGSTANKYCVNNENQNYCCKKNSAASPPEDSGTGDGTSGTVSPNGVPNPEAACCFVSNAQSVNQCSNGADYIRVYAHASVRVNSEMSTPCTSASYGNAYGASKWFYCADSTVDGCENEAGYDLTEPIVVPSEGAGADVLPTGNSCGYEDECETGVCVADKGVTLRSHSGGTCKQYTPPAGGGGISGSTIYGTIGCQEFGNYQNNAFLLYRANDCSSITPNKNDNTNVCWGKKSNEVITFQGLIKKYCTASIVAPSQSPVIPQCIYYSGCTVISKKNSCPPNNASQGNYTFKCSMYGLTYCCPPSNSPVPSSSYQTTFGTGAGQTKLLPGACSASIITATYCKKPYTFIENENSLLGSCCNISSSPNSSINQGTGVVQADFTSTVLDVGDCLALSGDSMLGLAGPGGIAVGTINCYVQKL